MALESLCISQCKYYVHLGIDSLDICYSTYKSSKIGAPSLIFLLHMRKSNESLVPVDSIAWVEAEVRGMWKGVVPQKKSDCLEMI